MGDFKVPDIGDDDAAADALEQGVESDKRSDELDELADAAKGVEADDVDDLSDAVSGSDDDEDDKK